MSKLFTLAFTLQCLSMSLLLAWNGNAQVKSIEEVSVHLSLNEVKVEKAFKELERITEFNFVFANREIRDSPLITLESNGGSLYDLLVSIATQTNLRFKQVNETIHVKESEREELITLVEYEEITISGTVSDENGEPMPGATITVEGTSTGTVSDIDGDFSIDVDEGAVLVVSFIGYQSRRITVSNQSQIDVQLELDESSLEEVVVVGYGTQRKADVTGSVASVGSETLENAASPNIVQALQGVMPGLSVSINSSSAEQNASIRIRGEQSITASNNPLIVLDGIPWGGNLSEIPSADVKSIDVLKDASATAIYGSRGANGVILITTNKGRVGETRVSIRSSFGYNQLAKKPNMLNGEKFYDYKLEYLDAEPDMALTSTEIENYNAGISTDWIDHATRLGQQQQHTLTLSGGGENHLFFISGNFLNTEGIAKNDEFSRYSLRLNFQKDLSEWLRFATNTSMTYLDRDGIPANFGRAVRMNPLITPYNEDGTINLYPWPEDPFYYNPLSPLNAQDLNRDHKLFTNNYFDIDIPFIKGLNYRINTGLTFQYINQETYYNNQTVNGFTSGGYSDVSNRVNISSLVENIINYQKLIGDHSIRFTGLYSFQWDEYKIRAIQSEGFPNHVLTTYQASSGALINPRSNLNQSGLVSQMARLNYAYKGKYLLTSTVRRDGYSGFGENTKYGVFPSVALSWNMSEENFIAENFDWIEQLKLRASWGKSGNQAIGAYSTLSRLANRNYLTGSNGTTTAPGYVPRRLSNPDLGWETTQNWNLGLDFIILNGRISGNIDVFKSNVKDLLLDRRISANFGIPGSEITENIGKTENKGLEIGLKGTPVQTSDFAWNLALNYSASRNKIVELYGDGEDDLLNRWFIGEPINVYFDYGWGGVFQLDDNIEGSAQPNAQPGWVKIIDKNEDGEITERDRMILGQTFPDFVAGLNSNFRYKNLSLNLFFSGVVGIEKPNNLGDPEMGANQYRANNWDLWDHWRPDIPSTKYPANKAGANLLPSRVPRFADASFVRLKDVRLAYDLSQVGKDLIILKSLKIYFNVNNVFTITNWSGIDPELSNQESIPFQRTYVMGLNVGF
ncbi:SusC/RagA family TonB-linked outer membrane protein [Cyclobacterium roseum]|uniref:SusC/RagA family TonB-linked outer membrane protein n=1 Tax=Cyclobacterium roseum TaxID=2666137 RepID=UPI00139207C8|nr:TonB-dependent receptor [Cyclobacterium roseum]